VEPEDTEKEKGHQQMEVVNLPSGSALLGYFRSGANIVVLFLLACMFILAQAAASLCDYWVSVW